MHSQNTVITHVKPKLLNPLVPNQMVNSTPKIWFYECFKVWHLNHMWNVGTLSKIMYNFINIGTVGKSSSCNFMLHGPKDASISLCVWSINRKDTKHLLENIFCINLWFAPSTTQVVLFATELFFHAHGIPKPHFCRTLGASWDKLAFGGESFKLNILTEPRSVSSSAQKRIQLGLGQPKHPKHIVLRFK